MKPEIPPKANSKGKGAEFGVERKGASDPYLFMPPATPKPGRLPPRWRVAAIALILLGVGLSAVGTILILNLTHLLNDRTLDDMEYPIVDPIGSVHSLDAQDPAAPAAAFFQQNRKTIVAYMLVYVGLTAAALVTLLLAMFMLLRLVRREMALAEMKANFVADVSHELKTPLALIRMFAETLQAGRVPTDEKRQEYYDIIIRETTRLTNLINNILDFAKIDAGKREYQLEPTDVEKVIRGTLAAYQPQLEQSGFETHLSIEPNLPSIDADGDAISQILVNLISNAIKYSSDEKYLAIDAIRDTRRGRRGVRISVHDRGIGIKPEDRAQVTEGFFRAGDERVRQQTGTGLGLALVRHIVAAHGGILDVESRLVKGSTFRVFLPASASPVSKAGPAA